MIGRFNSLRRLFPLGQFLFGVAFAVVGPGLGAGATGWILLHTGYFEWNPVLRAALVPAIYLLWLFATLCVFVSETTILKAVFRKPARFDERHDKPDHHLLIALLLYLRGYLLLSLPMVRMLGQVPPFGRMLLRSYATRFRIGRGCSVIGQLDDPDLIELGENVIIGDHARLIGHSIIRLRSGEFLYQTAPIVIESNVTIAGSVQIEMGTRVGAGSLIEPRSHLPAYTRVPPGEVWGGSPAQFRRKREGGSEVSRSLQVPARETGECVRRLLARALSLPENAIHSGLSPATCPAWDSLGKLAISAALFDQFGIRLTPEAAFAIDSVSDVERIVAQRKADLDDLPADPELLPLLDPAAVTARLASRQLPAAPRSGRLLIASTFTADGLASAARLWSRAFGIDLEIEFAPFNQVVQTLLAPDSLFNANPGALKAILVRLEDCNTGRPEETATILEQLASAIGQFQQNHPGPLWVSDLPALRSSALPAGTEKELRHRWRDQLGKIRGVSLIDLSHLVENDAEGFTDNGGWEEAAAVPYSPPVFQQLGIQLARRVRAACRPPKKILALDADGTLWKGILGEEGPDLISMSGESHCFKKVQEWARELRERGVLLALTSKNNEHDVWNLLESHPDAVLKRSDFSAARVNWNSKSRSIHEIAAELGVGLDAVVFVDDNPQEQLEVASHCPGVTVVPLPADSREFPALLQKLWCFDAPFTTDEDRARTRWAQSEKLRREAASGLALTDYLQSLQIEMEVRAPVPAELERVAQLTQKTNQFNVTLRRRTLSEIEAIAPLRVWILKTSDRFGNQGLVGVSIADVSGGKKGTAVLDTFLMSCRVLGRGLETAFLARIAADLHKAGFSRVEIPFTAGPRNEPALKWLNENLNREGNVFVLALPSPLSTPGHIRCF